MTFAVPITSAIKAGSVAAFLMTASSCGSDTLGQLRSQLAERISASDAEVVGLYLLDLNNGDSVALDAGVVLHAASMMKVPVMIQLFRDVDSRTLSLDDSVTLTNTFSSIVDGSPYQLGADDDSDSTLYGRLGEKASLRELVELMITASSNLAANILIQRLGAERIQLLTHELGARSMTVLRGVEDIKAYEAGLNNRTSARDMGILFKAIGDGTAASDSSCRAMIGILAGQEFNDGIPAGLPNGIQVAHKTGSITRINHDGGIVGVGSERSYVLVVLTKGIDEPAVSDELIADLSRVAYRAMSR